MTQIWGDSNVSSLGHLGGMIVGATAALTVLWQRRFGTESSADLQIGS
ncbi:MAG: hypothetical protein QF662_03320 [Phycisphaerae bacterium]|nr:hypothetical protein [Phycisphaerae bacterium]